MKVAVIFPPGYSGLGIASRTGDVWVGKPPFAHRSRVPIYRPSYRKCGRGLSDHHVQCIIIVSWEPEGRYQCAVEVRRHTPWSRVRCDSHGCWLTHSQFHSRRHSLRITLKYTTLVRMRSSYAWTMKPWQRSEWRLGFNSVYSKMFPLRTGRALSPYKVYCNSALLVLNGMSLNNYSALWLSTDDNQSVRSISNYTHGTLYLSWPLSNQRGSLVLS